jgi:hypothetical protein
VVGVGGLRVQPGPALDDVRPDDSALLKRVLERLSKVLDQAGLPVTEP